MTTNKLTLFLFLLSLTSILHGQNKLSLLSSIGNGTVKYFWPNGSIDREEQTAIQYTLGLRAKSQINPWFTFGTEIGIMKGTANADLKLTSTGSENHTAYEAQVLGMGYNYTYAYLYVFPEIHPFQKRQFYFRAFPVFNLIIEDGYEQESSGQYSGISTFSSNGYRKYAYDEVLPGRKHLYQFFFDLGLEYSLEKLPFDWFTEIRLSYIPRSNYLKEGENSSSLAYPDNHFIFASFCVGLVYKL